eukprot:Clim_evm15s3 gene=Clim_evmTU15s3
MGRNRGRRNRNDGPREAAAQGDGSVVTSPNGNLKRIDAATLDKLPVIRPHSAKEEAPQQPKENLRVVVRHLPPHLPEDFFKATFIDPMIDRPKVKKTGAEEAEEAKRRLLSLANGEPVDDHSDAMDVDDPNAPLITGWYFVPGALDTNGKPRKETNINFSRAYVTFRTREALKTFYDDMNERIFKSSGDGASYRVQVEYAPSQKMFEMPSLLPQRQRRRRKRKPDARMGTIEKDPEFQQFVKDMEGPREQRVSYEVTWNREQEMLRRKASLQGGNDKRKGSNSTLDDDSNAPKATPLTEYLRQQRQRKIRDKIERRRKAKAEKAAAVSGKKHHHGHHKDKTDRDRTGRKKKDKASKKGKEGDREEKKQAAKVRPALPPSRKVAAGMSFAALAKGKESGGSTTSEPVRVSGSSSKAQNVKTPAADIKTEAPGRRGNKGGSGAASQQKVKGSSHGGTGGGKSGSSQRGGRGTGRGRGRGRK